MSTYKLRELMSTLSMTFGELTHYQIINTSWSLGTRKNPLLFSTENGKFVYHHTARTANIKKYKIKLDEKNKVSVISSPILSILKQGFVTIFVEGEALNTLPAIDISSVAQLQATFHKVDNYDLEYWTEKLDRVQTYLLQNQLIGRNESISHHFSRYGLIHGDYSPDNLIKTPQGLVTIDLEHVLEGPIAFDLARPLLRVCHNETEQAIYLDHYFKEQPHLSQEELVLGRSAFFLIQACNRHRWGYPKEAQASLEKFRQIFK